MKRKVQIYVEGRRLELFNDEKIEVNSSVQNIADISKVFTDFSQSFSIPCSDINNQIFQHFYQTDVDSTIDHNKRRDAFIEIDLTFFRRGKISIEKANVKKGDSESYQVTFYGDVLSLKDKFGEDMLSTLDYGPFNHEYNATEIQNRIQDGTNYYDVHYPLISSNRIWQYNSIAPYATYPTYLPAGILAQLPIADVDLPTGAISYSELFPALRISSIFNCIASKYAVTFTGTFLTDKRFTDLFLWFKNKNTFTYTTPPILIDLDSIYSVGGTTYNLSSNFDLTNNSLNVSYLTGVSQHNITIVINSNTAPTANIFIDVFQNGNFFETVNIPSGSVGAGVSVLPNVSGMNDTFTFKVRSDLSCNIDFYITYSAYYINGSSYVSDFATVLTSTSYILTYTDLAGLAPDIKVEDFFAGILKELNLTCYPTTENTYQIEPLEEWYAKGAVIDITEYTDVDSIDIERIKLFKKIAFKYQKSESFINKQYFQNSNKEYGDTTYEFNYDGGEFIIDVPFENLMFNKFTGTNLQVGYALNSSFAPYIPKACLLYKGEEKSTFFYFDDGVTQVPIDKYVAFGQDLLYQNQNYTSNFGPETSTMLDIPIANTIYGTYYFPYLANLFNLKNRLTSVKTNLPISLITGLRMNDRLIIRDKRYIINEMKSDLTTGEVNFTLVNDFRPLISRAVDNGKQEGDDIIIPIVFPNGTSKPSKVIGAALRSDTADVIINPDSANEEKSVIITIPPVPVKGLFIDDELSYIDTEDYLTLRTEEGDARVITIFIDYTYEDGTTETKEKYIVQ